MAIRKCYRGNAAIKPEADTDRSAHEAIEWLIALQEDPDDRALKARFTDWRTATPQNDAAWAEAAATWDVLGAVPSARDADAQPDGDAASPVWRSRRGALAGAGLALVAASFFLFFLPNLNLWREADYSTGIAELRQVTLDDGTLVHLSANSAIDVAYAPGQRLVRLLAGEAFFEVTPNPLRPFVVDAGEVDATVLGTAFDMRLMAQGAVVAVEHGRVAVSHPASGTSTGHPLQAGDWAEVSRSGTVARGRMAPEQVAAWRQGKLVVDEAAVGDVIDQLRRYYPGTIVVMAPGLSSRHVTGVYRLDDPESAVRAIAEAHGAIARQIGPGLVISYF